MEKPLSAEDHNIYMYYPSSAGGGSQRLFRKVGSQSSKYFSESSVRQTGSYIYEEFLPTDGTDVKVCDFFDSINKFMYKTIGIILSKWVSKFLPSQKLAHLSGYFKHHIGGSQLPKNMYEIR